MGNTFYSDFDITRLKESKRDTDYRTSFQIDRDRIIHSSELRRLQGKTQVFLPGEYDFYRTRLTHSIEVAQIGRSICNYLFSKRKDLFNDNYFIDEDLVEAACLAHDLGHPPFGHAGERTLNKLMKHYGGFEGNAQTLRLLTETFYRKKDKHRGLNPVRAFLDSVLKYKVVYSESRKKENHFLYNPQKKYINFVFEGITIPQKLFDGELLNEFKSIECQIMDWADDTAYAINDIVDSISGGFLTLVKLMSWAEANPKLDDEEKFYLEQIIDWIKLGNYKANFGSNIGEFIQACDITERNTFMDSKTNRYKYKLIVNPTILKKANFYKRLSVEMVFQSSHLHQMEYKGGQMLRQIFELLEENYVNNLNKNKLLPDFTDNLIRNENNKITRARLVCDYISGMTDGFAMRNYKRLFDPDYSSLADLM